MKKIRKYSLDYVLKNIPAKVGDDQSISRHTKFGDDEVADTQNLAKSKKSINTEKLTF